jgi:hypothetical protein
LVNQTTKVKRKRKIHLPKDENGRVKAGPGRPKGLANRVTLEAKHAISLAFDGLGGVDALIEWANESNSNKGLFYSQIYTKLIPMQIHGKVDAEITGDGQLLASTMVDALLRIRAARQSGDGGVGVIIDNVPAEESVPQLVLSGKTGTKAA